MIVVETDRLVLRHLTLNDAPFIMDLVNEPSFLRFIGDRGVRSQQDARQYILKGPITSYDNHASIALLEKMGMKFEKVTRLEGETRDVRLFATEGS